MNRIIAKKSISDDLVKFEITTSAADDFKPGQYIILRNDEKDPEVLLPVIKTNTDKKTVIVAVHATSQETRKIANLNAGNIFYKVDGPFGHQVQIDNVGTVLCVAREAGSLLLLPVLASLRAAGNRIITILSARSAEGIILEDEIKAISNELITCTDDGSLGEKLTVSEAEAKVWRNSKINQVIVIGSARTIKETYTLSTRYHTKTQSFLYLDQTAENGFGIFRVNICGAAKAVCVDGINFNAYYPNLEEMAKRFACKENTLNKQGIRVEAVPA